MSDLLYFTEKEMLLINLCCLIYMDIFATFDADKRCFSYKNDIELT